ncbi:penicillin-binding protein [Gracilibacillus alcaliphilus]|uniref:penicillin-binding protein n=1 Tax=Gracilibacillus alcaliphilus TaxID=1401441 RepID=UPI0019585E67|nr:penicillin-binding protein [Gracilibacillus alcaliphilus]MBM7678627.1 penicillin-binding protein 2B [Gracilibacillus alcaliphilus]
MKNRVTELMPTVWIIIFGLLFTIVLGRFMYLQVVGEVSGVSIQELADEKRTNHYSIPATRGTIYDRNGMALAQEHIVYRLYAVLDENQTANPMAPRHVSDVEKTAASLAPIIDMEEEEIAERLQSGIEKGQFQVEFGSGARELDQKQKEAIEELELPGIHFIEEPIRFYPNGMFASHTIGLTDKQDDKIVGINGIEGFMNDSLTGVNGSLSYQRDQFNMKLLNPKEVINEPDNGESVVLTLDQKIQTLLEDALTGVMEEYNPDRVSAIVMNPKTGEILALGNRPSYNPNDMEEVTNWYNDAIATPFEQGSTMKIFGLAAAIEEGVWNPDEQFQSGSYKPESYVPAIGDHNARRGWGTISYLEGIQRSSNVAAAKLMYEKLGTERFMEYLQSFDLDKKTEIDLPGEVEGRLLQDNLIEIITTSFGQGSTATPMQMMKAATAIANGGKMMKPYVISKVVDSDTSKVIAEHTPEVVREPISEETAQETLKILETVITSETGTGHNVYNLNDYTVAGKTGTAQIPDPETGGYKTGRENYVFSFLGMAPADDPELMIYVSVKEPELEDTETGSAPVSFVFKNVMENSLRYLNIQPDKESNEPIKAIEMPEWEGKETSQVVEQLQANGIQPVVVGDGENITKINIAAGDKISARQTVFVATDQLTMPEMTGWSFRDILAFKEFLDLDVEWLGSGYVVKQSIEAGTPLNEKDYLMVELEEPDGAPAESEEENVDEAETEETEETNGA